MAHGLRECTCEDCGLKFTVSWGASKCPDCFQKMVEAINKQAQKEARALGMPTS